MEEQVAKREMCFENRTYKWQESEKGEQYQETTEWLQEILDEVIEWQEKFENQ